jgi:hypothetical protein
MTNSSCVPTVFDLLAASGPFPEQLTACSCTGSLLAHSKLSPLRAMLMAPKATGKDCAGGKRTRFAAPRAVDVFRHHAQHVHLARRGLLRCGNHLGA